MYVRRIVMESKVKTILLFLLFWPFSLIYFKILALKQDEKLGWDWVPLLAIDLFAIFSGGIVGHLIFIIILTIASIPFIMRKLREN